MPIPHILRAIALYILSLWLVGCAPASPPTPLPTQPIPTPIVIEITRMVQQQIIVTPTPSPATPCAPTSLAEADHITIGALLPLSPPGALLPGFAMQTALSIATAELNDQGGIEGRPVHLLTYDSAGTPERAVEFAKRLIHDDCAVAIIGFYHSSVALAVAPVAREAGIPVIVAEATDNRLTDLGYPEVFRLAPSQAMLAEFPAAWLQSTGDYNQDGHLTAAILAGNTSLSTAQADQISAAFAAVNIPIELYRVDLPTNDHASLIARLVTLPQVPDAIFIYIKGEPALTLQRELLAAGIAPNRGTQIVQHHAGLDHAQFWRMVPDGVGTLVARSGPWPGTANEISEAFAAAYTQFHGRWPEAYAFTSYDAVMILADAIRRAPSLRGVDLLAALETTDILLSSGHIRFSPATLPPATLPPATGATDPVYSHQRLSPPLYYLQYQSPSQSADTLTPVWTLAPP